MLNKKFISSGYAMGNIHSGGNGMHVHDLKQCYACSNVMCI